jgi:hypothetical protein
MPGDGGGNGLMIYIQWKVSGDMYGLRFRAAFSDIPGISPFVG